MKKIVKGKLENLNEAKWELGCVFEGQKQKEWVSCDKNYFSNHLEYLKTIANEFVVFSIEQNKEGKEIKSVTQESEFEDAKLNSFLECVTYNKKFESLFDFMDSYKMEYDKSKSNESFLVWLMKNKIKHTYSKTLVENLIYLQNKNIDLKLLYEMFPVIENASRSFEEKDFYLQTVIDFLKKQTMFLFWEGLSDDISNLLQAIGFEVEEPVIIAIILTSQLINECESLGHVFLSREQFLDLYLKTFPMEKFDEVIEQIIEKDLLYIDDEFNCYSKLYFGYESKLVNRIKIYKEQEGYYNDYLDSKSAKDYEELFTKKFNDEQIEAIDNFLKNRISIISGGAGTGKTELIKTILDIFNFEYPREKMSVSAFSAMAKNNISDRVEDYLVKSKTDFNTIHKLLDWKGLKPKVLKGEGYLNYKLYIIDEASMIDVRMYQYLFEAIGNNFVRLVIIGDKNQLPAIGAGNVFEDLIESKIFKTTVLKINNRQNNNSDILRLANYILDESKKTKEEVVQFLSDLNPEEVEFFYPTNYLEVINRCELEYIKEDNWKNPDEKLFQIVANVNEVETDALFSTKALNFYLENRIVKERIENSAFGKESRILLTNNVSKFISKLSFELTNGQIGIVEKVGPIIGDNNNAIAEFDFNFSNKKFFGILKKDQKVYLNHQNKCKVSLQSAYALTTHKLQGAEFETIMYCPSQGHEKRSNFHSKRMVYTAITRARQKLIISGDRDGFINQICTPYVRGNSKFLELLNKIKSGSK
ncbi:exodeoxyribonuclease V subunit alpha [Spiroplasma chinense]|uniref:Exodeoxyribonuclease V subunit alpha n=1 Tax=Spiroplasma chinense TaxID=216932 RepID=A0A5B9Y537_9MOLU|nr:AAA family ATPase [Spiroplasma chinense]QEH61367.1 exodeoxyribonuclease V subunit alpha [Spiroplasma chinense]